MHEARWSHDVPPYLSLYAPVIDRFGAGYYRGRFVYRCCPAHKDDTPSLALWRGDGGQLVFGCHAGCGKGAILQAVGLRWADCFPPKEHERRVLRVKEVARYDYTDEAGNLLYQVVRYHPKDFRQRRPDGKGGWLWNLDGVRRVLYRLPELIQADPRRFVLVVEGEKDVETARKLGLVATTAAGGAKASWLPEYSETLCGRHVAILPDDDLAGLDRAFFAAGSLIHHNAASVRIAGLPAKDLTAFVEQNQGKGAAELRTSVVQEIRAAPLWGPLKPSA